MERSGKYIRLDHAAKKLRRHRVLTNYLKARALALAHMSYTSAQTSRVPKYTTLVSS